MSAVYIPPWERGTLTPLRDIGVSGNSSASETQVAATLHTTFVIDSQALVRSGVSEYVVELLRRAELDAATLKMGMCAFADVSGANSDRVVSGVLAAWEENFRDIVASASKAGELKADLFKTLQTQPDDALVLQGAPETAWSLLDQLQVRVGDIDAYEIEKTSLKVESTDVAASVLRMALFAARLDAGPPIVEGRIDKDVNVKLNMFMPAPAQSMQQFWAEYNPSEKQERVFEMALRCVSTLGAIGIASLDVRAHAFVDKGRVLYLTACQAA